MLNIKWNTGQSKAAKNADILQSECANSVKIIAYLSEVTKMGDLLVERKSDAGRKYYSISAENAEKLLKALTS